MTEPVPNPHAQDGIAYGHVFASYTEGTADTSLDLDPYPDERWLSGSVTFRPKFSGQQATATLRVPGTPRSRGLVITELEYKIVNSRLVDRQDREGVWLTVRVGDIPVHWQATVVLRDAAGKVVLTTAYVLTPEAWVHGLDGSLALNLPDLIPNPGLITPSELAAILSAQSAMERSLEVAAVLEEVRPDLVAAGGRAADAIAAAGRAETDANRAEGLAQAQDAVVAEHVETDGRQTQVAVDGRITQWQETTGNATYAFTEPRQVNVFQHGVSPANSGSVNRAAFQAAIDAAPDGSTIVMPSVGPAARVHVNDKIVPRPGMTVSGLGGRGYIAQDVWGKPVFDLPHGEVAIERWDALSVPTKSVLAGAYRDGSNTNAATVVWLGGHRARLTDVIGREFTSVCRATPWDETAQALMDTSDGHVFDGVKSDGCDWGIVGAGWRAATLRRITGTYNTRAGSGDPGHIIYLAGQKRSYDVTVTDCTTADGTGGRAYSFKNVDGLDLSALSSRACEGLMDYTELKNARWSGLRALDDRDTSGNGCIYGFGGSANENMRVSDVLLEIHPNARGARIDGLNGAWSDVTVMSSRTANTDQCDIEVFGEGNTLTDAFLLNKTAFAYRGVAVYGPRSRIVRPRAVGTKALVTIYAGGHSSTVDYDPSATTLSSAFTGMLVNTEPTTIVRIAPTVQSMSLASGEVRGRSSQFSVMRVAVTGAGAITVNSPYDRPNGHEVTYEITNTTAAAMGAITFIGTHATNGVFPAPGAGKSSTISFRYDGTDNVWRETRRSLAA